MKMVITILEKSRVEEGVANDSRPFQPIFFVGNQEVSYVVLDSEQRTQLCQPFGSSVQTELGGNISLDLCGDSCLDKFVL